MRSLLRALFVLLLFVGVGFLAIGYWNGSRAGASRSPASGTVGTAGEVNVEKARETGAAIGEKAAIATRKVGDTMEDAALTTKIKAKMVLDDLVQARAIDVTSNGTTVTLGGTVGSTAERERALSLARETAGVSRVVDHLEVR